MRTGYETREGSRMICERIERAQAREREKALRGRLAVTRAGLIVLVQQIERELKTAA